MASLSLSIVVLSYFSVYYGWCSKWIDQDEQRTGHAGIAVILGVMVRESGTGHFSGEPDPVRDGLYGLRRTETRSKV